MYRVLVAKPEGKTPLGRWSYRCQDNAKMDLLVVGCGGMDWIELAQVRNMWRTTVNAVIKLLFQKKGNLLAICRPVSFIRRTVLHGVK